MTEKPNTNEYAARAEYAEKAGDAEKLGGIAPENFMKINSIQQIQIVSTNVDIQDVICYKIGRIVFVSGRFTVKGQDITGVDRFLSGFPVPKQYIELYCDEHPTQTPVRTAIVTSGQAQTVNTVLHANTTYSIMATMYITQS